MPFFEVKAHNAMLMELMMKKLSTKIYGKEKGFRNKIDYFTFKLETY